MQKRGIIEDLNAIYFIQNNRVFLFQYLPYHFANERDKNFYYNENYRFRESELELNLEPDAEIKAIAFGKPKGARLRQQAIKNVLIVATLHQLKFYTVFIQQNGFQVQDLNLTILINKEEFVNTVIIPGIRSSRVISKSSNPSIFLSSKSDYHRFIASIKFFYAQYPPTA